MISIFKQEIKQNKTIFAEGSLKALNLFGQFIVRVLDSRKQTEKKIGAVVMYLYILV